MEESEYFVIIEALRDFFTYFNYRSYFAFTLASEHHKFYMKLRNSFTSLKILSQDMNLPLTTPAVALPIEICPGGFETTPTRRCLVSDPVQAQCDPFELPTKKPTIAKSTSTRVKNLKKSMLNDNRLLKLRDKILKRSKSSAGLLTNKTSANNSLESNPNKENELPQKPETKSIASPTSSTDAERSRMLSPHRTRVKMGTRAFASKQFPNKSCDNIYDTVQSVVELDESPVEKSQNRSNGRWTANKNRSFYSDIETSEEDDGEMSLKSTSLSSLYGNERASEKMCAESGGGTEAYVIRESTFSI